MKLPATPSTTIHRQDDTANNKAQNILTISGTQKS